ncbi:hypothetical protein CUJ90_07360 [Paraburkholderia terricola]|nr:hypothetical protein CUJ90_07360 [Paraburkholderia terricola]
METVREAPAHTPAARIPPARGRVKQAQGRRKCRAWRGLAAWRLGGLVLRLSIGGATANARAPWRG